LQRRLVTGHLRPHNEQVGVELEVLFEELDELPEVILEELFEELEELEELMVLLVVVSFRDEEDEGVSLTASDTLFEIVVAELLPMPKRLLHTSTPIMKHIPIRLFATWKLFDRMNLRVTPIK
jgi:hypothetical protein